MFIIVIFRNPITSLITIHFWNTSIKCVASCKNKLYRHLYYYVFSFIHQLQNVLYFWNKERHKIMNTEGGTLTTNNFRRFTCNLWYAFKIPNTDNTLHHLCFNNEDFIYLPNTMKSWRQDIVQWSLLISLPGHRCILSTAKSPPPGEWSLQKTAQWPGEWLCKALWEEASGTIKTIK